MFIYSLAVYSSDNLSPGAKFDWYCNHCPCLKVLKTVGEVVKQPKDFFFTFEF